VSPLTLKKSGIGVKNCNVATLIATSFYAIATPATLFLFFLRVQAVFSDRPLIVAFFFLLWLGVLVSSALVPYAFVGLNHHISELVNTHASSTTTTGVCIQKSVRLYGVSAIIFSATFDTLVFIFISYRIVTVYIISTGSSARERARAFYRGQGLSRLSRMLLQSGQKYFLCVLRQLSHPLNND
jgi:hypothetical protein